MYGLGAPNPGKVGRVEKRFSNDPTGKVLCGNNRILEVELLSE